MRIFIHCNESLSSWSRGWLVRLHIMTGPWLITNKKVQRIYLMIMKVLAGSLATSLLDPRVCLVGASGGVYRFFITFVIIVFIITVVIVTIIIIFVINIIVIPPHPFSSPVYWQLTAPTWLSLSPSSSLLQSSFSAPAASTLSMLLLLPPSSSASTTTHRHHLCTHSINIIIIKCLPPACWQRTSPTWFLISRCFFHKLQIPQLKSQLSTI